MMFEEHERPGDVEYRLQYKLGLAEGVRPVIFPWKQDGAPVIELAHAEAAAGGGGAFVQGGYSLPNARKVYRDLYTRRSELFRGLKSLAHIGLAFFFKQSLMENPEHLRLLYPIREALGREHFLWDILTEDGVTRERLKKYQVVIVPDGIILEDEFRATLQAHVVAGGAVLWLKEVPPAIAEAIEKQGRKPLSWTSSKTYPGLRADAYWKAEDRQMRVVVHLLNYGRTPERDVPVSILLPWDGAWKLTKMWMVLPLTGWAEELHATVHRRQSKLAVLSGPVVGRRSLPPTGGQNSRDCSASGATAPWYNSPSLSLCQSSCSGHNRIRGFQ